MKSVVEKEQEISELRLNQDRLEEEILQLRNENLVIDKMFSIQFLLHCKYGLIYLCIHTYVQKGKPMYYYILSYYEYVVTYMHTKEIYRRLRILRVNSGSKTSFQSNEDIDDGYDHTYIHTYIHTKVCT